MPLQIEIIPARLRFKQPAGTSRGVYTERRVRYVVLRDPEIPERRGIGECAPLPALSCDDRPGYDERLQTACRELERRGTVDAEALRAWPSILFGLESALRYFDAGGPALWDTPFSRGEEGIRINGLIWMGPYASMREQIETKLAAGFRCIKLKIGAIDFDEELILLRRIRERFPASEIELRVDANGAFRSDDALEKLKRLAELELHSVEQPLRAGQEEALARLCAESPLPVALDEELIAPRTAEEKRALLHGTRPHYIVLKPSLHGGLAGCREWIDAAESCGIGWWITSALESNAGLNAIAQWCATLPLTVPQGLGTGALYTENLPLPLRIEGERLRFDPVTDTATLHKTLERQLERLCTNGK